MISFQTPDSWWELQKFWEKDIACRTKQQKAKYTKHSAEDNEKKENRLFI